MIIEYTDKSLYGENTRVFALFSHISPLKRPRAPIKLTYKVRFFNHHHSKIGVALG
jgi:hypothetical protein